jgi:hypothetical protein
VIFFSLYEITGRQEAGENYLRRSFITYRLHQILLGWSNEITNPFIKLR